MKSLKTYLFSVADPGFVKREGRESKCRDAVPGLKKSLSGGLGGGGGLRHIFFFASFTLWGRGTVRLPETSGVKSKKKKKKKSGAPQKKGGGGAAADSAPLDPPLLFDIVV